MERKIIFIIAMLVMASIVYSADTHCNTNFDNFPCNITSAFTADAGTYYCGEDCFTIKASPVDLNGAMFIIVIALIILSKMGMG